MSVGRICSRTTHLADRDETVQAAAERMRKEHVGTLVVLDGLRKPVGILTDRDLALRVVAPGLDPRATTVERVMTTHPQCVREWTSIEDSVATMRSLGVRRLPVVDGNERLAGIVSSDDVLELVTEELGDLGRLVGGSHAGIALPATRGPQPAMSGLQRAFSDPQC